MPEPTVSVLLPVFNEIDHIDACIESLVAQDYTGELSIVAADGGSSDGTRERLEQWQARLPRLVLIDNRARIQSEGLNLAARVAVGEILVRADAHTTYAPDYVRRSVETLLAGEAVAVGGRLTPKGQSRFGRAVAAAMTSPLAIGPGRFHHAPTPGPADTVYLGTFRSADFASLGGFRSFPSGAVEDADLFFRWRRLGRTVFLDPAIRSTYQPRDTPKDLAHQFCRYGMGKTELLYVNGRWPSWRPAAPLALIMGIAGFVILGLAAGQWWPLFGLLGIWSLTLGVAAAGSSPAGWFSTVAAAAIMQLAYGVGLLMGLLRRPSRVRRAVSSPPYADG